MHLPSCALPDDDESAVRSLLPLQLVPARNRFRVRLNAMIEADRVQLLTGDVVAVDTPSQSGKGQRISRCPRCQVAVWSNYSGAGDAIRFVRVGTLDEPTRLPPDIHIYTGSKQPWLTLPPDTPAEVEYYRASERWPAESLERRAALLAKFPRRP